MKSLFWLSSIVLPMLLIPLTVRATPFSNGSFETGGTLRNLPSGDSTTVPPWVTGRPDFTMEYNVNGENFQAAQEGSHYISFGHNSTTGGTLSQTFDTIPGTVYTVNYFLSLVQGDTEPQSMSVSAFDGAMLLNTAATDLPTDNASINAWFSGTTLIFTALSTSTTL